MRQRLTIILTFVVIIGILAVLFLVFLNGFFVATEFALVKVRATQLETDAAKGHKRAKMGLHLARHLDAYLSACQLGITLASLGLGWIGEPVFAELLPAFGSVVDAETSALLVMMPVVPALTVTLIVTLVLALALRAPRLQVTVPLECVQVGEPGVEDTNVTSLGSVSVRVTPAAFEGPLLVMVTV